MPALVSFVQSPAPHAVLGGACVVLALAQDQPMVMLVGAIGIAVAVLSHLGRA